MTQIVFQVAAIVCCIYTTYRIGLLIYRKSRNIERKPKRTTASPIKMIDEIKPENEQGPASSPPVREYINEDEFEHSLMSIYTSTYLDCKPVGSRAQVYISKENHALIRRFLSVVAPEVSISGYVNKVIDEHLKNYRDEISKLHSDCITKPLQSWKQKYIS